MTRPEGERGAEHRPTLITLIKMAARTLATPAKVGTLITIPDLVEVARRNNIPIAVRGTREWIIEELLKTAYDYGVLDKVCGDLIELVERRYRKLTELTRDLPDSGELYRWVRDGLSNVKRILGTLVDAYRELQAGKQ